AAWLGTADLSGDRAPRASRKEAWDGLSTDELRPIGSILATQGEILEKVAQGQPLDDVLSSLCLLIERDVPDSLCSILLVEDGVLTLGAGPSLPESYACGMDGMAIVDGIGPCGTAAYRAEMAIYPDIAAADLVGDTRRFILDHGVRACWSIPVFDPRQAVIGTFAISSTKKRKPTDHHMSLLRTAGHLAGIAISRHQADREHRRLQKELMHRQKLESLGIMAGGIAHDFNNLLTAIVGSLSLLEREPGLSEGGHRRLQLAQRAADSATDLTTEMLTYAGLASVELGEVDLGEEIRGVVAMVTEASGKAAVDGVPEIRFTADVDDSVRRLHGDASQLRQLVHNLVQNGVDALPAAGGEISIWLRRREISDASPLADHAGAPIPHGSYASLGVLDTGDGIDAARLSQVFDPFFSSKKSGRGLGLAV
ncbi:MAG: GAF domain-containing protein, partial [Acidobacteriota bacterium]